MTDLEIHTCQLTLFGHWYKAQIKSVTLDFDYKHIFWIGSTWCYVPQLPSRRHLIQEEEQSWAEVGSQFQKKSSSMTGFVLKSLNEESYCRGKREGGKYNKNNNNNNDNNINK